MKIEQLKAFCAMDDERPAHLHSPFLLDGAVHATDGKIMVRWNGAELQTGVATVSEYKVKFMAGVRRIMAGFDLPEMKQWSALPLAGVTLEPVIEIEAIDEFEQYVARPTYITIGPAWYDARLLLRIRQILPDVWYYPESIKDRVTAIHFFFGDGRQGQGVLMPVQIKTPEQTAVYWNGAKYRPL